jgi:non-specific serine/threonine protein kinase
VNPRSDDRTSYFGRDEELDIARRLLAMCPVVTMTGPGGVGKTRLALRVAATAKASFPGGVTFVELDDLRDAQLLAGTVADRLGLRDQSARPAVDVVIEHVRDRRMLLVLDNCEHLIGACAQFVATLVAACPRLAVLATSRQSLAVAGERLLPVPPLAVPDEVDSPVAAARFDAVRLFIDRAVAVLPSFAITPDNYQDIVRLCRVLDGVPLAIELAAVRLRSLSLSQITDRLTRPLSLLTGGSRIGPERQQSLRALIEWSYRLCSLPEQLLWARASVFSGCFGLDAAEQVCGGAGVDHWDVLDLVDALLDKSVLVREQRDGLARYRMPETLREYGHDRLEKSGDQPRVRRLHRDWYADLTTRFDAEWVGPNQVEWVASLRNEHANLRVALDYCACEPGEATVGLAMATNISPYWGIRGFHTEVKMWLDRMLAVASPDAPERVAGLRLYGMNALLQGDAETAGQRLTAAGELVEDEVEAAYITIVWGMIALFSSDWPTARDLLTKALKTFRAHGEINGELTAAYLGGLAIAVSGQVEEGRTLLRETIAACEKIGEIFYHSLALWALGSIDVLFGDPDDAERAMRPALRLTQLIDNRIVEAFIITNMVLIAEAKNEHHRAALLLGIEDAMWSALGADPDGIGWLRDRRQSTVECLRATLGDTGLADARAEGRSFRRTAALRFALDEPMESPSVVPLAGCPLTKRELEIATLIAEGLTNKDIAAKLFIAPRTAETHVANILTKLAFNARTQVATWITTRAL